MASSSPHQRRNSRDEPPDISDSILRFMELFNRNYPELQDNILELRGLVDTFEEDFKKYTKATKVEGIMGIVGGTIAIAGLALAPFTMGASVAGAVSVGATAGACLSIGAGISSGVTNLLKIYNHSKFVKNIKDRLEDSQMKINPMADILIVISKNIEILRGLNKLQDNISFIVKCASEILRIIRIDDIGEVAAQVSKTVRLTATLAGVLTGIGLVLDILSVISDKAALDDMDKLAGNSQISESEMKSKAGTFIVEMRNKINDLQNIMEAINKAKDCITRGMDLI